MGETALHVFASRGDTAAVRRILPGCDYTYILMKSEFRLTKGLDALHTALIFQQFDIADAILERLQEIWVPPPPEGLELLKNLLTVRDPVAKTTTTMLMCRFVTPLCFFACLCFAVFTHKLSFVPSEVLCFRWGTDKLLDRVINLLQVLNHGNSRFPEMLQVVLFETDRSGLTALHHAVRSGNKLVVRWCMMHGAVACPRRIDRFEVESRISKTKSPANLSNMNVKSLIPDGASKLTMGTTLWECVFDSTILHYSSISAGLCSFIMNWLINFVLLLSFG
jgi:hypothetical protein